MNRTRRLMANLTLLNILLAMILLGSALYAAWLFGPDENITFTAVAEPAPAPVEAAPASGRSPMDYAGVAEQNLFHPERRIPLDQAGKELPRPDLVLYGTLIAADTSIAYVEDRKAPYSTPGRGKRQIALKKGDNVSGYVLKEVEPTRIMLVRGDDRLVVLLDSKDSRASGAASAQQPPGKPAPVAPSPRPSVMPAPQQPGAPAPASAKPGAAAIGQHPAADQTPHPTTPQRRTRYQFSR